MKILGDFVLTLVLLFLLPVLLPVQAAGFLGGAAWRAWVMGWRRARVLFPILEAEDRLKRLVGDAVVFPDGGEERKMA